MTDNEIIKALEKSIPVAEEDGEEFVVKILRGALDLINRQKAEIEKPQDYNADLIKANTALSNEILEIKSKAIKEFANNVYDKIFNVSSEADYNTVMVLNQLYGIIENLEKEITEGQQ